MISPSNGYSLVVRQEPERAKAFVGPKEKGSSDFVLARIQHRHTDTATLFVDRKPVDPPPIVQLRIRDPADPAQ